MSREMVNSGIPWIGDIPKGWSIVQLKRFCKVNSGREIEIEVERSSVDAIPVFGSGGVFKYTNKPQHEGEAVMFGRKGTLGKPMYVNGAFWAVDTMYFLTFTNTLRAKYCFYLLSAFNWDPYITQTALPSVVATDIVNAVFVFPSLSEQQKIASFLDRKCSEIDEMIALQEKIIEELKAYKQSVIIEAVTKGLNPEVPMKDSGIDWIGEIPEHWQTVIFKSLFCIKKVIAGRLGYDVLSVTQQGLKVKDLSKNEGQVAQDYSKYQIVNIDDFVMNHMDLLTGYIDCATMTGVTSPDYRTFVNRNHEIADNNFFLRIFQKCYKDRTFYHLGQGVSFLGRWRLPKEQLNAFVLPFPPLNEQKEIASYLNCHHFTIITTLHEMEEDGLVRTKYHHDPAQMEFYDRYFITDEGAQLLIFLEM